jgi:hypothetical protein
MMLVLLLPQSCPDSLPNLIDWANPKELHHQFHRW